MNVVNSLYLREQGKRVRRDYSIALRRLKCHDYDEFRGILPSTDGPDFNPEPPVFACSFCSKPKYEHLLALANEDGRIAIQDTNVRSDHNPFEGHQAHRNAIFDIAWKPGEMQLVSASGDHTAILWDVNESGQLQEVSRFHAHTRSVKTVAFPKEDKMIFATGARDGVIMLWDTRLQRNQLTIRPDKFIYNSHSAPGTGGNTPGSRNRRAKSVPSRASSITGLVFQNGHSLLSCGAGDGKLKVWDIRKSYSTYRREPQPQYSMSTPNGSGRSGFTCLALDPGGLKLYASCMDNTIYCYNIGTYEEQPVGIFKGHKNSTFYVKACLSPDGQYLLSGSSDEHAYIWDTSAPSGDTYKPIVKLVGHGAEVTCVAWRPVGEVMIVTCSDDARHCLWRVGQEHRGDNDQVELHGWAESVADEKSKVVPSTPVTPATPSFTSWRRWGTCIQRTPDNNVMQMQPRSACKMCHQLSTPCLQCIAARTPLPTNIPHGSKKRLEVLWEEDSICPECEREARESMNPVSNNADAPARRLFSPSKKRSIDEAGSEAANGLSPIKKGKCKEQSPLKRHVQLEQDVASSLEQSPKKPCISPDHLIVRRRSPRKRSLPAIYSEESSRDLELCSPRKRLRMSDNFGASKELSSALSLNSADENAAPSTSTSCAKVEEFSSKISPQKEYSRSSDKLEAGCSPSKRRKLNESASASASESKLFDFSSCSMHKENVPHESKSPAKRTLGTPLKRRISDRITDSPHKRLPLSDDLQGITKIEDSAPCNVAANNRPKVLCKRHRNLGFSSPTLNLPNYILDGTSPHHKCSPVRHQKESVDWLTQLRRERTSTDKRQESECSSDQDASSRPSCSKKTPNRTTPCKASSSRITPAKGAPSRTTPGKGSSSRTTPGKGSSSRTTPGKGSSSRSTPSQSSSTSSSQRTPIQAERKTSSRRPLNTDSSSSASGSTSSASSLLRFFRVSEKPIEQHCSLGNTPPNPVNSVVV